MEQSNVLTSQQIELVQTYYHQAHEVFVEIEAAKENLKDILDAAADGSKLPKKVIRAYFVNRFKATLKEFQEQADLIEILSGTTEE